jgi:DNA gyrase subunit B
VTGGHLYIAQPPLFKAKKGKRTTYLKDEKALTEHLFNAEAASLTIRTAGPGEDGSSEVSGERVMELLTAIQDFLGLLEKVARRHDVRVVHAFLESFDGGTDQLRDRASMQELVARLKTRLTVLYRPDDLRLTQLDLEFDEGYSAWEIHARTRDTGIDRRTHIGWEFVTSGEFKEVKRLMERVRSFGAAPYTHVPERGNESEYATERELFGRVDSDSRKGYDIQRYKGLGEMNPEQLWETTMDPTKRTLVQVKVEDLVEADDIFTILMGDQVDQRRNFIEDNALNVRNLDV